MTQAIRIGQIKAATALVRQITVTEMCAHRRSVYIVRTRQMGMALAKELTLKSLPDIGRKFGGYDHTTVLHAVRKIDQLRRAGDPDVTRSLGAIRATLGLEAETADPEIIHEALVERVLNRLTAWVVASKDGDPELAAFSAAVADRVAERVASRIDRANLARSAPPIMAAVRSTIDAAARLQRDDWSPGRKSAERALNRELAALKQTYGTMTTEKETMQ